VAHNFQQASYATTTDGTGNTSGFSAAVQSGRHDLYLGRRWRGTFQRNWKAPDGWPLDSAVLDSNAITLASPA
jgi:hypothetical protein